MTVPMQFDALPEDKRPSACVACGACQDVCPKKLIEMTLGTNPYTTTRIIGT